MLSGINPGDEVVTSGVFKLRNGAAVLVNNTVQPGNDPAPTPEDTEVGDASSPISSSSGRSWRSSSAS